MAEARGPSGCCRAAYTEASRLERARFLAALPEMRFQSGKWARDGLAMSYILFLAGEASVGGGDASAGLSESPLVPVCKAWDKSLHGSLVWPHKVGLFTGHVAC